MGIVVVALLAANAGAVPETTIRSTLQTNQVRRKLRQTLIFLLGKSVLDVDILPFDPAKLP